MRLLASFAFAAALAVGGTAGAQTSDPLPAQDPALARQNAEKAIAEAVAAAEKARAEAKAAAEAARANSIAAWQAAAEAIYSRALSLEQEGRSTEAFHFYHRAASAGSAKAAKRLAEIYDEGLHGVRRAPGEASKWRNAALTASMSGDELYAHARALEEQGGGEEAVGAYTQAARRGSSRAAVRLGEIYDKGLLGIRRDFAEALKWYNAARVLGKYSLIGNPIGVSPAMISTAPAPASTRRCEPANPPAGRSLYEQAVAMEFVDGCAREAMKLHSQAAKQGDGKAAKRLGEIYDKGLLGTPKDYAESLKWYNAARILGEETPMAKGR